MAFNTIKLYAPGKTYIFEDLDYVQGSVQDVLENSLIGVNLSTDELTFTIRSRDAKNTPKDYLYDNTPEQLFDSNNQPLEVYALNYSGDDLADVRPYHDRVELYHGNTLEGAYYIQSVERIGHGGGWTFTCVSAMGIIERQEHAGGIYTNETAGNIIAEIMGSLRYTIDGDLAATTVNNWLPYAKSARDNLKQVLFACGGSILKDSNGDPEITYNLPTTLTTKTVREVYAGSSRDKIAAATEVQLTEHTFRASVNVAPEIIYEAASGVSVSNYKVIFDKPYHTLTATGLTIDDSGANYAVISGTGTLTGIPYVHIQRVRSKSTGAGGEARIVAVDNAYLISQLNSDTALDRLAAFYAQSSEISAEVLTDARPGSIIKIPDPNNFKKTVTGYVKNSTRTFSGTVKSALKLTQGWQPNNVGNSYDSYLIVQASDIVGGSWSVPAEIRGKRALITLFGGAYGGSGGYDGENGHSGRTFSDSIVTRGYGGAGGLGGAAGQPGGPGKYLVVNIASLANSYTASIGTGGAGGSHGDANTPPTAGSIGGDTTFGSYTTADGNVLEGSYFNLIDGDVYGELGDEGYAGADGGSGGDVLEVNKKGNAGTAGGDVLTWTGGQGGAGFRDSPSYGSGGGGGGAAYGASAADCTQSATDRNPATNGANAVAPAQSDFYRGGAAGNGGGGGGGSEYRYNGWMANYTNPGSGGLGSSGGQGADGFILVYYKAS